MTFTHNSKMLSLRQTQISLQLPQLNVNIKDNYNEENITNINFKHGTQNSLKRKDTYA